MKNSLSQAKAFRETDHFEANAWKRRGLMPSDAATQEEMRTLVSRCADNVIAALEKKASEEELTAVIQAGFDEMYETMLDTEEKEFIGDLFYELSSRIGLVAEFD